MLLFYQVFLMAMEWCSSSFYVWLVLATRESLLRFVFYSFLFIYFFVSIFFLLLLIFFVIFAFINATFPYLIVGSSLAKTWSHFPIDIASFIILILFIFFFFFLSAIFFFYSLSFLSLSSSSVQRTSSPNSCCHTVLLFFTSLFACPVVIFPKRSQNIPI